MSPNIVVRGSNDAGGSELCYFTISLLEEASASKGLSF